MLKVCEYAKKKVFRKKKWYVSSNVGKKGVNDKVKGVCLPHLKFDGKL